MSIENLTINNLSLSLLDHLPWVEFDDDTQCILLQDKTVCAAFDLTL
ncbi:MAG: conjugal transfer protein TraC [Gammaproteobacteria bacterium]|nr:conjugal transfer protein TraC [Gammaproteobacteria bacterium]